MSGDGDSPTLRAMAKAGEVGPRSFVSSALTFGPFTCTSCAHERDIWHVACVVGQRELLDLLCMLL